MLTCCLETSASVGWIIINSILKVHKEPLVDYFGRGFTVYFYRWRNKDEKITLIDTNNYNKNILKVSLVHTFGK